MEEGTKSTTGALEIFYFFKFYNSRARTRRKPVGNENFKRLKNSVEKITDTRGNGKNLPV